MRRTPIFICALLAAILLAACNPVDGSLPTSENPDGSGTGVGQTYRYTGTQSARLELAVTSTVAGQAWARLLRLDENRIAVDRGPVLAAFPLAEGEDFLHLGTIAPGDLFAVEVSSTVPDPSLHYSIRSVSAEGDLIGDLVAVRPPSELPSITSPVTQLVAEGFTALEVDQAQRRVFISSSESDTITVLDFGGSVIASMPASNPARMTIHEGTIFVGTDDGSVLRFDRSTLVELPPLTTSIGRFVVDVAVVDGRLWALTDYYIESAELVSVDLATGAVEPGPTLNGISEGWLESSEAIPGVLYLVEDGSTSSAIYRFDVASTPVAELAVAPGYSYIADTVISPDGQWIYFSGGSTTRGYSVSRMGTGDLAVDPGYWVPGAYADSLDVTDAAGGRLVTNSILGPRVYEVAPPRDLVFASDVRSTGNAPFGQGLAWSGDGSRLFVVTGEWYEYRPHYVRLNTIPVP